MLLVVGEKPSQSKSYADVLGANVRKDGYFEGNNYIVTWCIGHLVGLAPADAYDPKFATWRHEDLPIIPPKWKNIAASDKKKQLKIISELMKRSDVDTVICATDAGREGEYIFRAVYEYCGCSKPIKRLWLSSMEESAISEGFRNLKPGAEYESLYQSALCRSQADWLVGINSTRLFSVLYGQTFNIGRVQTPTLAMLVERENTIKAFVKEPFYTAVINCGDFTVCGEKLKDKQTAESICAACDGKSVTVTSVQKQEKLTAPPKLYDLTTLQREANRQYGYTAQQTLDYIQSLYEKKLATYPRTDSRFITADMSDTVLKIIGKTDFKPNIGAIIGKVTDHHAIIPTASSVAADVSALPTGEQNVLQMLSVRLIQAVGEKHIYAETTITADCNGYNFTAKGKTVIKQGWKPIGNDKDNDKALPDISEGQSFSPVAATVKEGFTSPPKHFTEDTLLSAMETAGAEDMPDDAERKGLGTPATRAAIIEKLVKSDFFKRDKKQLLPTDKAFSLIAIVPEMLKSPQLTAEWENELKRIEWNETTANAFMTGIKGIVQNLVHSHTAPDPDKAALFSSNVKIGKCPRCGGDICEKAKGFFCDNRDCSFAFWKDNIFWKSKKKKLTADIVAALLKDGRVALKGLFSEKTGKRYDAIVLLDDTGGKYVNFKLEFAKRT